MKRAGGKNPGAWQRANEGIGKMSTPTRLSLATHIANLDSVADAFAALTLFIEETGVEPENQPEDVNAWATTMATNGIPLQVWMGRLTFTTYEGADQNYKAKYQQAFHKFAHELRPCVRNFFFALRQARDLIDRVDKYHGNPGGLPDGNKAT